jgi:hypothetical protein
MHVGGGQEPPQAPPADHPADRWNQKQQAQAIGDQARQHQQHPGQQHERPIDDGLDGRRPFLQVGHRPLHGFQALRIQNRRAGQRRQDDNAECRPKADPGADLDQQRQLHQRHRDKNKE